MYLYFQALPPDECPAQIHDVSSDTSSLSPPSPSHPDIPSCGLVSAVGWFIYSTCCSTPVGQMQRQLGQRIRGARARKSWRRVWKERFPGGLGGKFRMRDFCVARMIAKNHIIRPLNMKLLGRQDGLGRLCNMGFIIWNK